LDTPIDLLMILLVVQKTFGSTSFTLHN